MNPIPQQSEAKPDLARTLRESCVRFTEAADESFFFAPAASRAPRQRHSSNRRPKSASNTARPIRVRRKAAYHADRTPQLKPDAPTRRIDRYPKP